MASYCKQCSIDIFGEDYNDFKNISSEDDTNNGLYALVICEGCGITQVDHTGKCVCSDCLEKHRKD
jgi:hypothetical protein